MSKEKLKGPNYIKVPGLPVDETIYGPISDEDIIDEGFNSEVIEVPESEFAYAVRTSLESLEEEITFPYGKYEILVEMIVYKERMEWLNDFSHAMITNFVDVYSKHFNAWESESRKRQHALGNIRTVEYDIEKNLFYVHYKETEDFSMTWYHYDPVKLTWW